MATKTLARTDERTKRIKEYADAIVTRVTRAGYIGGSHKETILMALGIELGVVRDASSRPVPRTARQKLSAGDRQALVREALELALKRNLVEMRYDKEREEFQLYVGQPALRWTLVDASGARSYNYVPRRQCEFTPWHDTPTGPVTSIRTPHARTAQLATRWNS